MVKFWRLGILFLIIFLPFQTLAEKAAEVDTIYYKDRSRELFYSGVELDQEGKSIEALDTFNLFLDYRKIIFGNEHYMLGSPYSSIGVAYKNIGRFKLALENFELAERNYSLRTEPNPESIAKLYINIGNVYRARLDYINALNYYNRAVGIYLQQDITDPNDLSDAYYSLAEINYLLGNNKVAIELLQNNLDKCDNYNQIYFHELLALIHQRLLKNEQALSYYQKTLKLATDYYDDSEIPLTIVYLNYAEFLFTTNKFDESLSTLEEANQILRISQPNHGEQLSRYYELKGGIFQDIPIETQQINSFKREKKENIFEAIDWYKKALNALSSTNKDLNISELKLDDCISFLDCLEILGQIGDAYFELALIDNEDKSTFYKSSLLDALTYYKSASQLTQQARREISSDESKIQLAELEYLTFTKTIETAYLAYEATSKHDYLELAFNNAEQLKSSSIFDKLSDDLAQENSLIPDSLLRYEKRLNSTISIYTQKIQEESNYEDADSVLIEEYNSTIFEASRERDELNRMLEEEYSDYYTLKYAKNMLSISQIQKKMGKNEAIFEYVIVEPDKDSQTQYKLDTTALLFTFLITKDKLAFQKATIESRLENSIETIFRFTSNPAYLFTKNDDSKKFCVASHNLYKLLITPFEKELINKNLVFIPDGNLNYISFDGLLKTLPDTSRNINFSNLDYLIQDYSINYANSANILFQNRRIRKKIKNKALAFAPEYQSEIFEMSNAKYTLMPLPGIKKEVDAIAKTINTTVFSGKNATELNFRKNCKDYDILHLAMHAYINDSLPSFSRLAFFQEQNNKVINEDGWLNTIDIYNLELNARLAVLSACNTGIGKLQQGEGMMSLARGFLFAGCPSIIMSLWEVEDESGTQIMSSFYKNLKKGKTKDEALRQAKLTYLENANSRLAHPHYWMSFKSIGDNSPIYTSYDIYFFALLILLILAFAIDQSMRIRKIKKERKSA